MTEDEESEAATPPRPQPMTVQSVPRPHRKAAPIVPLQNVAGRALDFRHRHHDLPVVPDAGRRLPGQ